MRCILVVLLSMTVPFVSATHAQSSCNAYDGWQAVAEKAQTHVIMFGELHGTNESAGAIGGFLCELVGADIPVRFGIEAAHDEGQALDAALSWPLDKDAVLVAAPDMWSSPDGRSSEAVLRILSAVALWRSSGADISVFAFDSTFEGPDTDLSRSSVMAREVDAAMVDFEGAVVLFTGSYHTRLGLLDQPNQVGSLASEVTGRPVLALEMKYNDGQAFVTVSFDGAEPVTGAVDFTGNAPEDAPIGSIELSKEDLRRGQYYTGPITASPPAFPDAIEQ